LKFGKWLKTIGSSPAGRQTFGYLTHNMADSHCATRLFVGNLHSSVTEGDLIRLFQKCGTVVDVNYMWHKVGPKKGQPKGFAFVGMKSSDEVERAISKYHGYEFKGRKLTVSHSENEHLLTRQSRGSSYSLDKTRATSSKEQPSELTKRFSTEDAASTEGCVPSGGGKAVRLVLKKQRTELVTVEERMRKLQEALKDVS
jgi:RNA recognition motif-containing protein